MNRIIVTVKRSLLLMLLGVASLIPSACTTHFSDYGGKDVNEKLLLEKNFPSQSGEKLAVEVVAADVVVTTWNRNEVSVKIYGDEDALEKVDITAEKSGEGVFIEIEKKSF